MMKKGLVIILILFFAQYVSGQADITPPDVPIIDSVSVWDNITGQAILAWFPSDSADTQGYIIYRSNNTIWEPIDTVLVPTISYIDITAQAHFHPELYRIAAFDESGNLSPATGVNQFHNSMYIFPYEEAENCEPLIRLNWNKYVNWPEGIRQYNLYCSINFGPFQLLNVNYSDIVGFKHFNIEDATSYCYYVVAISNTDKTSTSNKTCIYIDYPNIPDFTFIESVSVKSDGKIEIKALLDHTAEIRNFRLERKSQFQTDYATIKLVNNYPDSTWTYIDNVNTSIKWTYRLISTDNCNNDLIISNTARNIVCNVSSDRELNHFVWWNPYRFFPGQVESYNIYRKVDKGIPQLIGNTNDTTFIDNVEEFALGLSEGEFTYYVEANEEIALPGIGRKSTSSEISTIQFDRVFVPNAFTPNADAFNSVFMPVCSFISKQDYLFTIYDRWGNIVFQTKNIGEGWDGRHKDAINMQGTYVYQLFYKTLQGNAYEKAGYVWIIIPQ